MNYARCPSILLTAGVGVIVGVIVLAIVALHDAKPPVVEGVTIDSGRDDGAVSQPKTQIGLVLAGGGAKGAYQVGVWRVLSEFGLSKRITVFSGTSIGSVNAALFAALQDPDACEDVWRRHVGAVFEINQKTMLTLLNDINGTSEEAFGALSARLFNSLSGNQSVEGVCDLRKFRKLLRTYLPTNWSQREPYVYATALQKDSRKLTRFCLNGKNSSKYIDYISASTAIPIVFGTVMIDGVSYIDGGACLGGLVNECQLDNTPIRPILENHPKIKTVIVVYLDPDSKLTDRITLGNEVDVNLVEIIPSGNTDSGKKLGGGALDFSNENVDRLIRMGYQDAKRTMDGTCL